MSKAKSKVALLVIDMQKEYFEEGAPLKVPKGGEVLENIKRLVDAARVKKIPLMHIRHIGKDPDAFVFGAGSPLVKFADELKPKAGEPAITKTRPGSFYMTELDDILLREGVETVVITGLMSFMCCDTTAREAHARGYSVLFVRDATAAIDIGGLSADTIHEVVLAVQGFNFSRVVTTDEAIAELSS
ncbi:MAG: cysteine hydrolase [Deltaproteobacteria bacterium]|uniref:Cysteine hydrolase n=1 Tax=Candidatus Zymogenus saltonus TaxID=2844893 RepID=A0A9D8PQ88_9DELT|nr:cysteine hydrolase [Candidatus Zymogenus saltonus]